MSLWKAPESRCPHRLPSQQLLGGRVCGTFFTLAVTAVGTLQSTTFLWFFILLLAFVFVLPVFLFLKKEKKEGRWHTHSTHSQRCSPPNSVQGQPNEAADCWSHSKTRTNFLWRELSPSMGQTRDTQPCTLSTVHPPQSGSSANTHSRAKLV